MDYLPKINDVSSYYIFERTQESAFSIYESCLQNSGEDSLQLSTCFFLPDF